jgi:hypothetical protein
LKNWQRDPRNPILNPEKGNFDDKSVSDPSPIVTQDRIYLYYGAFNKLGKGSVGLGIIPLKEEITDFFVSPSGIWDNIEVKENSHSIGIVCPLYKKLIYFKSKIPGKLKIEAKFNNNERYKIFDVISVKEISALCRYIAEGETASQKA